MTIRRIRDLGHRITIESEVYAAETGELIDLTFSTGVPPEVVGKERAKIVRHALRQAVLHEVDECLRYLDGEAVCDPHPDHARTF